jgi:hypothetical protein
MIRPKLFERLGKRRKTRLSDPPIAIQIHDGLRMELVIHKSLEVKVVELGQILGRGPEGDPIERGQCERFIVGHER